MAPYPTYSGGIGRLATRFLAALADQSGVRDGTGFRVCCSGCLADDVAPRSTGTSRARDWSRTLPVHLFGSRSGNGSHRRCEGALERLPHNKNARDGSVRRVPIPMETRLPAIFGLMGIGAFLLGSCASPSPGKARSTGIACPECKVVVANMYDDPYLLYPSGSGVPISTVRRHECPGCQGSLVTLLKEGKPEHRCSVCDETPYGCRVASARETRR